MNAAGAILALDLGTTTGFAILRVDGRVESGEENFAPRKGEGAGMRYVRFCAWLVDLKQSHPDIAAIHYEDVKHHGPGQVYAAHVYGGLLAMVQSFGEHHRIPYHGHNVATVKSRFAGHGNASKGDMVEQCRALGFRPEGDNEADAIAILHVATDRCPILTKTGTTKGSRRSKPAPAASADGNPF